MKKKGKSIPAPKGGEPPNYAQLGPHDRLHFRRAMENWDSNVEWIQTYLNPERKRDGLEPLPLPPKPAPLPLPGAICRNCKMEIVSDKWKDRDFLTLTMDDIVRDTNHPLHCWGIAQR